MVGKTKAKAVINNVADELEKEKLKKKIICAEPIILLLLNLLRTLTR